MNKTYNILIYGLGNIGKSYLKGLLNSKYNLNIFTYDTKKNNFKFLIRNKKIKFSLYQIKHLPQKIDLCILSTTSNNKVEQIKKIFKFTYPKNIIMEKLIAQSLTEIKKINSILNNKKTKVWVNTQMRTYIFYKKLKKHIKGKEKFFIKIYGNDWGLACNSIHYMDVYSWMIEKDINIISVNAKNKNFYKSKRSGYYEFFGEINIKFEGGSKMKLICKKENKPGKIKHLISASNELIYFDEAKNYIYSSKKNFTLQAKQKMIFEQINFFFNRIVNKKDTGLPSLEYSSKIHEKFFSAINLNFFGSIDVDKKINIT